MSEFDGHTPGPWVVATSCSYRRILSKFGDPVCVPVTQRSDGHPDLDFRNGGFDGPDARLIAAAPDLLAENQRLREALQDITSMHGEKNMRTRAREALGAAD